MAQLPKGGLPMSFRGHDKPRYTWEWLAPHLNLLSSLKPQTTIYKWMFGETTIFYIKIWNHPIETSIYKWLFRVPRMWYKWSSFTLRPPLSTTCCSWGIFCSEQLSSEGRREDLLHLLRFPTFWYKVGLGNWRISW